MPPFVDADEHAKLMFSGEFPSIGPALEGTEVRIGAPGEGVEGERGELLVRGHSTMIGYFEDPETTARTIDEDGWLRTGDEGFFRLHAGRPFYYVTGRLKEVIIRDAEKYSPLRLESRLLAKLPELAGKLTIVGFSHKEHGEEVGAYVEMILDDASRARVAAAVQALPVPERPKVILYGETGVPRTHTGKVQRRKMLAWFAAYESHRGAMVFERLVSTQS
jgi:long-chain acyl-CoA synthetase